MAKRGFFAEIHHQNQLAAKRQAQAQRVQARQYAAAVRDAERAQREAERAAAAASRARATEQKAAEREAKRLHLEARLAEVASLNAQLADAADGFASILAATLPIDDFVDLEKMRRRVKHPPFSRSDLEVPVDQPATIAPPPKPSLVEPVPPTGLGAVFGGKKKHADAVAAAHANYADEVSTWEAAVSAIPARQAELQAQRDKLEGQRVAQLATTRAIYERQCNERQAEVDEHNRRLDELIDGLAAGTAAAVGEYIGIVLDNSVYPDVLEVSHEYAFDAESRELELSVLIAPPEALPAEKSFRYVKANDEVVATELSKKDQKDRYANVVHQVALRSMHEVFEADRGAQIRTVALVVASEAIVPATGRRARIEFVAVAAERASFLSFDLANVIPLATLQHLGASIAKSPFDLVGIDGAPGVRGR